MEKVILEGILFESCPLCRGGNTNVIGALANPISSNNIDVRLDISNSSLNLMICNSCKLIYKNYSISDEDEFLLQEKWSKENSSRWSSFSPIRIQKFSEKIKQIIQLEFGKVRCSILDIGAGEGGYLDHLHECERFSLDVNPESSQINSGRGINTMIADICDKSLKPMKRFDVITCFDVFEHLRDPKTAIKNINKLLNKGGILILETGNIESYLPRVFNPCNWWYVDIPEHKIFWSKSSLAFSFELEGLDMFHIEKTVHKGHALLSTRNLRNMVITNCSGIFGSKFRVKNKLKVFFKDHLFVIGRKSI